MRGRFGKAFREVFLPDCDTACRTTHSRNYLNITNTYESDLFAGRDHGAARAGDKDKFFEGQRQGPTTHTPNGLAPRSRPGGAKPTPRLPRVPQRGSFKPTRMTALHAAAVHARRRPWTSP